jgi:hypothetical protein
VPIPAVLRDHLDAWLLDAPASGRIFHSVRESYGVYYTTRTVRTCCRAIPAR